MNINDEFCLELTEEGLKQFRAYHEALNLDPLIYLQMYAIGNNRIKMPMWEIMHILGPVTYMGGPNLIKNNELTPVK